MLPVSVDLAAILQSETIDLAFNQHEPEEWQLVGGDTQETGVHPANALADPLAA